MKILEKGSCAFKAQLDTPERLYSIKCILLEKETEPDELNHMIRTEQLQPLFGTTDNDLMTGEYENKSLYLSMVFSMEGVFFEAAYSIDFVNGVVMFGMDRPSIVLKDFVMPADMDPALAGLIKEKMNTDKHLVLIDDARFDKYYSDKFLDTFVDYVGYLEGLLQEDKCKDCIHWYKYRMSWFCNDLYVKNRCIPEE